MLPLALLLLALIHPASEADLKALAKEARSKKFDVRLEAYDALIKAGPEGIEVLEPILRRAEEKAAKDFLSLAGARSTAGFRKWLKKEIAAAQKEAIAVIQDKKVYPDDAHGAVGQPIVDGKVSILRELWLKPSRHLREKVPDLDDKLYYIKEAADYLKRAGFQPNTYGSYQEALADLDASFGVERLMYSKSQLGKIRDVREFNAETLSVATDEERRFLRILNDYRLMLGLNVLELDDKLVLASRKHSQEMMDMDYFAHESPVEENRSPSMRARKEGFGGWVMENCAISGDARAAFDGWYNSSGHHRALIASGGRQLGAGQGMYEGGRVGRHWTMLVGSGASPLKKGNKASPRETYLARRARLQEGDVETRFLLARFCLKQEMAEEGKELLREVVQLDDAHKQAHELLGHVKSNGRWVTAEAKLLEDLENKSESEVLAEVRQRLGHENAETRLAAIAVIEKVGASEESAKLVTLALNDDASEVRVAACDLLGRFKIEATAGPLKGLLNDRSLYVAHSAAVALYRLGDSSGVPRLFVGLRSNDLNSRLDAHRKARAIFGRDFGFQWDLPKVERAKVVDDWEAWVTEMLAESKNG